VVGLNYGTVYDEHVTRTDYVASVSGDSSMGRAQIVLTLVRILAQTYISIRNILPL